MTGNIYGFILKSNLLADIRCLQNPVSHSDAIADISGKNQSGIAILNFFNGFESFTAALFVLRNGLRMPENMNQIGGSCRRKFQHRMKISYD